MAKGITKAVKNAALMLPNSKNRTTMTKIAPSVRFISTVSNVVLTSFVRSYTAFTTIPSGSDALISFIRSPTPLATFWLFSPINIKTVLSTTSRPFCVAAPDLSSLPSFTSATSFTRTILPRSVGKGISEICLSVSTCPGSRINH